jgi:hypothetical protein
MSDNPAAVTGIELGIKSTSANDNWAVSVRDDVPVEDINQANSSPEVFLESDGDRIVGVPVDTTVMPPSLPPFDTTVTIPYTYFPHIFDMVFATCGDAQFSVSLVPGSRLAFRHLGFSPPSSDHATFTIDFHDRK